jgi:hypothetical protein
MKNSPLSVVVMKSLRFQWIFLIAILVSANVNAGKVKILHVGDTQKITDQKPNNWLTTMDRVMTDDVTKDADFILQTGDITEDSKGTCWDVAQEGWRKLDGKIPYVLGVGNNDLDGDSDGDKFNEHFPLDRYAAWPSFIDNYDRHNNVAHVFNAGEVDWLVISIVCFPGSDEVDWAEGLITNHPDKKVIIVNHTQGLGDGSNGGIVWKMVKQHPNVVLMLLGHNVVMHEMLEADDGHKVGRIQTCWHDPDADHFFGVIEIDTETGVVDVEYYSPFLGKYYDDKETSSRESDPWTWEGFEFDPLLNTPPEITSTLPTLEIEEGEEFTYTLTTEDAESDALTLSAETLPAWLSFDSITGVLSGTPESDDVDTHDVTLRVSDGKEDVDQSFKITVNKRVVGINPILSSIGTHIANPILQPGQSLRILVPASRRIGKNVKVINISGEATESSLVLNYQNRTSSEYQLGLSTRAYPVGCYFLRFEVDGIKQRTKFIIHN